MQLDFIQKSGKTNLQGEFLLQTSKDIVGFGLIQCLGLIADSCSKREVFSSPLIIVSVAVKLFIIFIYVM